MFLSSRKSLGEDEIQTTLINGKYTSTFSLIYGPFVQPAMLVYQGSKYHPIHDVTLRMASNLRKDWDTISTIASKVGQQLKLYDCQPPL